MELNSVRHHSVGRCRSRSGMGPTVLGAGPRPACLDGLLFSPREAFGVSTRMGRVHFLPALLRMEKSRIVGLSTTHDTNRSRDLLENSRATMPRPNTESTQRSVHHL